jgi:hypothetical protein
MEINPYASPVAIDPAMDVGRRLFWPALGLMITSAGWVLLAVCIAAFLSLPMLDPANNSAAGGSGLIMIGAVVASAIYAVVVFSGAVCMARGRSYVWSMSTAILALIPWMVYCYVLSLPFGIWAIVVLRRPEVREAFERGAFGPR